MKLNNMLIISLHAKKELRSPLLTTLNEAVGALTLHTGRNSVCHLRQDIKNARSSMLAD